MITIACCLWHPNEHSFPFSLCYDESWADKLYRGFKRNLTKPFRFVVFTDEERQFGEAAIEQKLFRQKAPITYRTALEAFRDNEPTLLVGLDTIVTGNCDAMADYCLTGKQVAVPRDPIHTDTVCNGVVLAPSGNEWLTQAPDSFNDMTWMRANRERLLLTDDLFPGQVKSYRCEVKEKNRDCADNTPGSLGDARIVYFHGREKPHEMLEHDKLIARYWV